MTDFFHGHDRLFHGSDSQPKLRVAANDMICYGCPGSTRMQNAHGNKSIKSILFRTVWQYMRPYRFKVFTGLGSQLLSAGLAMVFPWVLKLAIDSFVEGNPGSLLWQYAGIIMGVTVFQCLFRYTMRQQLIGASRLAEYDLRAVVFDHVQQLPRDFFYRYPTGDIMSRITNDIHRIRMVMGPGILQISNTIVSLVFALTMMIVIDPLLTLYSILPLPLMPVAIYFLGKQVRKRSEKVQEQMAAINSQTQESFSGIRVVKGYNLEDIQARTFGNLSREYVRRNLHLIKIEGMFVPIIILLAGFSTLVILFTCGWWVIMDRVTLGGMVAFMEYMVLLTWPMFAIGWVAGLVQQGAAAMDRLQKLLNEKAQPDMLPDASEIPPETLHGPIEFRDVAFRYRPDAPDILKNVSFTIEPGEFIAIMGASGSGKTTILNLLTRSHAPTAGQIILNGHDTHTLSAYDIRELIGVVPQDVMLFSETIFENLEFGSRRNNGREYIDHCLDARIHEEIEGFPDRYDTILGERGINLSGGQKQRLTLARALVREPLLLILDDPFSSVDITAEEAILAALRKKHGENTMIIVSHRVNTARRADRILILDDGRIVEFGTHDELMARDGYYRKLFRRQQLVSELETL